MSTFVLYGVRDAPISDAKMKIEAALGFRFEERDSTYQAGVYYFFGARESENFILKRNEDPFDGNPAEQKFSEYPFLLYVNSTDRFEELNILISMAENLVLLRHEVF